MILLYKARRPSKFHTIYSDFSAYGEESSDRSGQDEQVIRGKVKGTRREKTERGIALFKYLKGYHMKEGNNIVF